jgi:hypothetical protein
VNNPSGGAWKPVPRRRCLLLPPSLPRQDARHRTRPPGLATATNSRGPATSRGLHAHHVQIRRGPYCASYTYVSYAGRWATPYHTEHVEISEFNAVSGSTWQTGPARLSPGPSPRGHAGPAPPAHHRGGPRAAAAAGPTGTRHLIPHRTRPRQARAPAWTRCIAHLHLAAGLRLSLRLSLCLSLSSGEYTIHLGGQVQLLILSPFPSLPSLSLSPSPSCSLAHRDFLSCATSLVPRGVASSCRRSIRGAGVRDSPEPWPGWVAGWLID